jgi:hypothetical protein
MSRWSPVYVPEIETGRHVKINACTVEIKIKWMIRKHMTYENTYRDDTFFMRPVKNTHHVEILH